MVQCYIFLFCSQDTNVISLALEVNTDGLQQCGINSR